MTRPVFGDALHGFQLGSEWPDWWADAVSRNHAVTHNADGRWRGGPDFAVVVRPDYTLRCAKLGDWIVYRPDGSLDVVKNLPADGPKGHAQTPAQSPGSPQTLQPGPHHE